MSTFSTSKAISARPIRGKLHPSRRPAPARQVQAHIAQQVESGRFTPRNQHLANTTGGCPRINDSGAEFFADDSRPVILFDGACNLCNGGVQFVLDWDTAATFRFASLQSDAGRALLKRSGRAPEDISSIVLVSKQRHWIKSTAVLKIAEELKAPVPVLSALLQPIPGFVRDSVYKFVSEYRYSIFGEANQCRMMIPEWRARFLY
eukprot:jgi/Ulvmu1/1235/UM109_0033.1